MAGIWISSILLMLIGYAASDYDPSVCQIFKQSHGLIPPPLPTDFEFKGEYIDYVQKRAVYEEMYFDYTNWRAKYMYLQESIEHHFLFDYITKQVVQWDVLHPGVSIKRDPLSHVCTAINMEKSTYKNLFGYQDWTLNRPKMYNSNQVLRYGGKYLYAANGTEKLVERGLLTNKFISCLYDSDNDATMSARYYFTNEKVLPAGGTILGDVILKTPAKGSADNKEDPLVQYLSVPVMLQQSGNRQLENDSTVFFNETTNIAWFKGEPEFETGTFQIPPWIYCTKYGGRKDMKKFPTAFSTRLLRTQFQVGIMGDLASTSIESYEAIFYYGEKNLARRDYTPNPFQDTDIHSKFESYTPVSSIYDFNQGLRYTINQPTGRCFISPIPDNDFFDTHKSLIFRKLGTPEEIFLMETDEMEYKGRAFTRDIECDVWTGKFFDDRYNATFIKETYISTNGWHEMSEEMVKYGVPVKHMVIKKELDGELTEGIAAFNFLKFKPTPPRLALFDIQGCIEHIERQQYAIILSVNSDVAETLFKYKFLFLETAQYYLADMAQTLTPLRVQRLQLRQKNVVQGGTLIFLLFTLMDKPDLRGIPLVISVKGADLKDAALNLQRVIDGSRFNIQFFPPGSKDAIIVHANAGDLYTVTGSGNLTLSPMPDSIQLQKEQKKLQPSPAFVQNDDSEITKQSKSEPYLEIIQRDDNTEDNTLEKKGMTPGHLALLSFAMLFIGVGIGIAVMYLYVRMHNESQVEDRIHLSFQQDSSGGNASMGSAANSAA